MIIFTFSFSCYRFKQKRPKILTNQGELMHPRFTERVRLEIRFNCLSIKLTDDFVEKLSHCTHLSLSFTKIKLHSEKKGRPHAKISVKVYLSFIQFLSSLYI